MELSGSENHGLQIEFPKQKVTPIFKDLKFPQIEGIDKLNFNQSRILFLITIRQFLGGDFFLEEMSEVARYLQKFKFYRFLPERRNLYKALHAASRLSYEVRIIDSYNKSPFDVDMFTTLEYLHKNKQILNSLGDKYSTPSCFESGCGYDEGAATLGYPFPEEKIKKILKDLGFTIDSREISSLSAEQAELLFLVVVREFLKGRLFFDEMTTVLDPIGLAAMDNGPKGSREEYSLLAKTAFEAYDENIYLRSIFTHDYGGFDDFMNSVLNYLREKQSLLMTIIAQDYSTPSVIENEQGGS